MAARLLGAGERMRTAWHGATVPEAFTIRALLAHIAALEADNAALLRALHGAKLAKAWPEADDWVTSVLIAPHPGAALLEEHRKALVRARNEGLEKAAQLVRRWGHASIAKEVRTMKEPE